MLFLLGWRHACRWQPGNLTWCWPLNSGSRRIRTAGRTGACPSAISSPASGRCDRWHTPWCSDAARSRSVWAGSDPWWSAAGCRPWNRWYPTRPAGSRADAWAGDEAFSQCPWSWQRRSSWFPRAALAAVASRTLACDRRPCPDSCREWFRRPASATRRMCSRGRNQTRWNCCPRL